MAQAASTMNQSDIRGLVRWQRARAYMDIFRHKLCFLFSRVQSAMVLLFESQPGWNNVGGPEPYFSSD